MSNTESTQGPEGTGEPQGPDGAPAAPDAAAQPAQSAPAPAPSPSDPDSAAAPPATQSSSDPNPADAPPVAPNPAEPAAAQAPADEPSAEATRNLHPGGPQPAGAAPQMAAPADPPPGWHPGAPPQGPPPMYARPGAVYAPPKPKGRGMLVAGALALALIAGGAGGVAGWLIADREGGTTVVESVSMDAGSGMTYTEIVDKVSPSVVTIVTDAAEGSGVVYSDDGYIITNNHVVDGAQSVEVRFSDGTTADASIVATDATQDMAVVQVSGVDSLEPIAIGDSDGVQVGDVTVAIGSPLGLEGTVTTGIVSALNRSMSVSGEEAPQGRQSGQTLTGLLQTDAAINMGNSGGALVNGNGELIGINTAIASTESGNIGLGFAIPSNTVKETVEQLIEHGSVEQGYLGVSVTDTDGNGAMVLGVEPGSPADEAGLQEGDVIIAVDGAQVTSASEVVAAVQAKAAGDQIAITYTRDGQEQNTEATLTSQ